MLNSDPVHSQVYPTKTTKATKCVCYRNSFVFFVVLVG